jgi:hypothetical protein
MAKTPARKSAPLRRAAAPRRAVTIALETTGTTTNGGDTSGTTNGGGTTGTTTTGGDTSGTTTPETNLLLCSECDKPFPIPTLIRTYRIYMPLTDLATANQTRIGPPQTQRTTLTMDVQAVARMDRLSDAFGGIPLNALDTAASPQWGQPTLSPVTVSNPLALVRSKSIGRGGATIHLSMQSSHVSELLLSGATLVPRADGGFIRLKLGNRVKAPPVQHVSDLRSFLVNPSIDSPDGNRSQAKLTQQQLADLASGAPVVAGTGSKSVVLVPSGSNKLEPGTSTFNIPPNLAMLLPIDQTWTLKTYERGRLASSISLTPQEEVTVDVYSWDRKKTSSEDTTTFDSETSADSQGVDRDTRDVFGEVTKTGTFNWGLNGNFSGYGLTIGGNAGNNQVVGNVTRNTLQNFHEQTIKASEKVHTSRQLKITESEETGSENRTTRKLRNNNLCHPVTYHYFELDARYVVTTQFTSSDAVFVLLVDNPLGRPNYSVDFIRTYEAVLRSALLDPAVAAGFDAARTLWMLSNAAPVICNDCVCSADCVGSEDSSNFQAAISGAASVAATVSALQANASSLIWSDFFRTMVPFVDANGNFLPPNPPPTIQSVSRALFVDALNEVAPGVLGALAAACGQLPTSPGATATAAQLGVFNSQFSAIDLTGIDAALLPDSDVQTRVKGLVEARIRSAYSGMALRVVRFLAAGNKTGNQFVDGAVSLWNSLTQTENNSLDAIVSLILGAMSNSPGFGATDGIGLKQFAQGLSTTLAAWVADNQTDATAAANAKTAHKDLFASIFPPGALLAAQERFDALQRHLQAYSDYYANVIVSDLISRGQFPLPSALLPYLGCISLQPMAVVDGQLAYAIDLSVSSQFNAAANFLNGIVSGIDPSTKTDEVALPTPGFVVEPKLSCCSACEDYVEAARTIDLENKQALADQAKFEASRREQLLAAGKYDPFDPIEPAIKVNVEQTTPTTAPTA